MLDIYLNACDICWVLNTQIPHDRIKLSSNIFPFVSGLGWEELNYFTYLMTHFPEVIQDIVKVARICFQHAIVKIVREKYLKTVAFEDREQLQSFLSELYVYLVDQMHSCLHKVGQGRIGLKIVLRNWFGWKLIWFHPFRTPPYIHSYIWYVHCGVLQLTGQSIRLASEGTWIRFLRKTLGKFPYSPHASVYLPISRNMVVSQSPDRFSGNNLIKK